MDAGLHGTERILGRTKLHPSDVTDALCAGAAVMLGSMHGVAFLLFYSPRDKEYKIAITSAQKSMIVTVLNEDYELPKGIGPVTDAARRAAYRKMTKHLARISVMEIVPVNDIPICAAISVTESGKPFLMQDLGKKMLTGSVSLKRIMEAYGTRLRSFMSAVTESKPLGRIRYHLIVRTPDGVFLQEIVLRPDTLAKYLSTA